MLDNPHVRGELPPDPSCRSVYSVSRAGLFRDVVSGQRTGVGASVLRGLLRIAEVPYSAATTWRNRRYNNARATIHQVDVPVVSVGNLTVGGTGKTPMVEWVTRHLRQRGHRVAIVSRGYGAKAGQPNDEALELAWTLGDVPHVQDPDRVAAARTAIERHDADALVLDDGFQHRRLARDFDLVMLDATAPLGYGHQLPRGLLRESPAGLARADAIVLSRADLIDSEQRAAIRTAVAPYARHAVWCEVCHRPRRLLTADQTSLPVEELAGRRVAAFCGIGNPGGFRGTVARLGVEVVDWFELPDHAPYDGPQREAVAAWAGQTGAELLLCTRKDLVKLKSTALGGVPVRAVAIELEFLSGRAEFEAALATRWASLGARAECQKAKSGGADLPCRPVS